MRKEYTLGTKDPPTNNVKTKSRDIASYMDDLILLLLATVLVKST